jgi:hypothetical protein
LYIYSQASVQERISFETNTSTDLNKRNFETSKEIEKLQGIIEGSNGHIRGDGKL